MATLEGPGPVHRVCARPMRPLTNCPPALWTRCSKPENKDQLVKVLTYHVVAGKVSSHDLIKMIKKGGGKAELKTVEGGILTASLKDGKVVLDRRKGGMADRHHRGRLPIEWRNPR